jgi:hypothetical protein
VIAALHETEFSQRQPGQLFFGSTLRNEGGATTWFPSRVEHAPAVQPFNGIRETANLFASERRVPFVRVETGRTC